MKALILKEYGHLSYEEAPEPAIGPGEALIRVAVCGICGSDVHGMDGSTGRRLPPLIMGHEAAGVIAALGEGVTGWSAGDRVTFDSTIFCGECRFCRRGQINLCDHRRVLGVSCDEYRQQGAFAEFVTVPTRTLYRLPEDLSFTRAALVEPLSVALHAVSSAPVSLNDRAVVMGAGVIGLLLVQLLRAAGCEVISVDLDPGRLALARELGARHVLQADQSDVAAEVRALTHGHGADLAFEAVGRAPAVAVAIQSLRKGGHLTLIGNLAPRVEIPLQAVVARQLTLVGSCASAGEYPTCLDLMARGVVEVDPLISAVAPLAEGTAWFARLGAGEPGLMKVVLTP
jgi:L-iditol 2-dehydrogenase